MSISIYSSEDIILLRKRKKKIACKYVINHSCHDRGDIIFLSPIIKRRAAYRIGFYRSGSMLDGFLKKNANKFYSITFS
jgi:hypothetical protein